MSSFLEKFNEETIDETKGIVAHENEIEEDTSYLDKQKKKKIITIISSVIVIIVIIIIIILSRLVKVPEFENKLSTIATKWGNNNNIEVKEEQKYDSKISEGIIISQSIKSGTRIFKGNQITIIVSKGKDPNEKIKVPDFKTVTASEIKIWKEENELSNVTIKEEYSDTVEALNVISYEFDKQKEYAKKIGVEAYLKEFSLWFSQNTTGSCTIDGKKVEQTSNNTNTNTNNSGNNTINNDKKVVGDEKYGYITIPSNWTKFYDINGNGSLQYSYANVYIVSLNILNGQNSAKEYASNYMYNKQNSSDVTGVTGATVTIGKNKKYTAYQVYMYYPSYSTYLVTYWFEAEDGKVHYIALEGPQELSGVKITDYLYIPESFSLEK